MSWGRTPADLGRYEITGQEADRGRFKTPTLRGLIATAPYMHDGSLATLEEVVDFYNRGGGKNPNLDPVLAPLGLSKTDAADLVAFLKALSDPATRTKDSGHCENSRAPKRTPPGWAFPGGAPRQFQVRCQIENSDA